MQIVRQYLKTASFHLLVWTGFAVYEQAIILATTPSQFNLPVVVLYYSFNALVFYTNSRVLLPHLFAKRYYIQYAGAVLLLLAIYAVVRTTFYLLPGLAVGPMPGSNEQILLLSGYRGSFFLFVSMGYWFAQRAIALETQKREQEQQLRTAERSLMEAKLAFLKSQINPHFLFNSLNFLYAQVYPLSENAAKGILLLSNTMRYALHKDSNGKVMLTQEVKHLRNYIEINQLRFNNQLQINFEIEGNLQFSLILPLVLITFVENCFKHGDLSDPNNPLIIHLSVVQNRLTFRTRNKKRDGPKELSTGIGLSNTNERLEIVYKDRYALVVDNRSDYYTCDLIIDL